MLIGTWLTFGLACFLFSISPGAGVISSISSSLSIGVQRTYYNILGLQCALLIHLFFVSLGLGAIISSSIWAFIALKYCGACYLIYLGVRKWHEAGRKSIDLAKNQKNSKSELFLQGLLINLMNPKSIIFLAAFLPQFIEPAADLLLQYTILGTTVIIIDCLVMMAYAVVASSARQYISNPHYMKVQDRFFGLLYVIVGIGLARAER